MTKFNFEARIFFYLTIKIIKIIKRRGTQFEKERLLLSIHFLADKAFQGEAMALLPGVKASILYSVFQDSRILGPIPRPTPR